MSAPPTELTALNMQLDAQARNAYGEEVNKRILQRRAAAQRAAILAQQQAGQQQNLYDQAAFQQQAAQQQGQIQTNRDVLLGQQQTERDKLLNAFHEGADYRQAGFQSERDYRLAVYQAMHAYDQAGYQQARDENQAWYQAGHAEQAANLQGRRDATLHGYSLESQTNQGNIQGQLAAQHGGIQAILAGQQDTFQQGRDTRLDQFQQNRDTRLNQFQNERDTRLDQFQQNRDERHVDLQGRLHQIQLTQDEEARMTRLRNAISRLDADPNLSPRDREEMRTQLMTGLDPLARRSHESALITQRLQQQNIELGNERGTLQNMALRDFQDNGTTIHTRTVRNDDGTERQVHFYTGQDGTMHILPENNAAAARDQRAAEAAANLAQRRAGLLATISHQHNQSMDAEIRAHETHQGDLPQNMRTPHPWVRDSNARAAEHRTRVQRDYQTLDQLLHGQAEGGGWLRGAGLGGQPAPAAQGGPANGNAALLNNLIPQQAETPANRGAADESNRVAGEAHDYHSGLNLLERAGNVGTAVREMNLMLHRARTADRGLNASEREQYEIARQHVLDHDPGLAARLELPETEAHGAGTNTRFNGAGRYRGTADALRPLLATLEEHRSTSTPLFNMPGGPISARNQMEGILRRAVENNRGLSPHELAQYNRFRSQLNVNDHRRLHNDTAIPE